MKKIIFISTLLMLFALLNSCQEDQGPYIIDPIVPEDTVVIIVPPQPVAPTVFSYPVLFGSDIKPMLQQNCIKACHNKNHPKLDLRPPVSYDELLTLGASAPYVNTVNPDQSIIYLHLAGIYTLMPEGGPALSQGKIDSVFTWITQGALNN